MRRLIRAYFVVLFIYYAPNVNAQPVPCDRTDGKGIVACVEAAYPAKLTAGVSLETRRANMAFLRDRLIETARCETIDVGLNLKRGGPSISYDFIAWKHDGLTEGVDIASGYDDTTKPLKLMWHTYGPPNYGYPTYKAYGPVSCVIEPPKPPEPPAPPVFDPAPLFNKIEQLEALLKQQAESLNTQIAALRTQFANLERALPTIESRVFTLEQIPVPQSYRCRVQFGLRCTVTAEVNP